MLFSVNKPVCWSLHCDSVCTVQRFPKGRRKETYTNHMRLSVIGYGVNLPTDVFDPAEERKMRTSFTPIIWVRRENRTMMNGIPLESRGA